MALPGIQIGPGITIQSGIEIGSIAASPNLVLNLDAATYSGSGNWIDSVNSLNFTLNNSPTYSNSIGGGSFLFDPASSQFAASTSGLGNLGNWTVEVWHYYTGTNSAGATSPCLVTEQWPNVPSKINFALGSLADNNPNLQAGFFNGSWRSTPTGYTLTANNWYQIVGTYDGQNINLYVNGTRVTTAPETSASASGLAGIALMKRWDTATPLQYWGGRLASVKIWDGDINFEGVRGSWLKNKARYGL